VHGRHVEQHPFNYNWIRRFPDYELVVGGEGTSVFSARGEGAWWLIYDEGTLGEFLDPVADAALRATLVRLERFDDREEWESAVQAFRRRPAQRMVKRLREDG
jgi:hypothetical protein